MRLLGELSRLLKDLSTGSALTALLQPALHDTHGSEVAQALPTAFPPSDPSALDQAKQAVQPISLHELPCLCIDNIEFFLMHNKISLASVEWSSERWLSLQMKLCLHKMALREDGLNGFSAADSTQDPDPVQIGKQLAQQFGYPEARLLLLALMKLERGLAELVKGPGSGSSSASGAGLAGPAADEESAAATSDLVAQVIRAFREQLSKRPSPSAHVAHTFFDALVEAETQAEVDAVNAAFNQARAEAEAQAAADPIQVEEAAREESAAQATAAALAQDAARAAAEQGAAMADAVNTAALVEDVLKCEPRPKEDIVQDVIALAASSKHQDHPCNRIARSIALKIDPPSPYERLLGRLSDEHDAADAFTKGTPAAGTKKPKAAQLKAACKESGLAVSGTYAQLCGRLKLHEDQNLRHAGSFGAGLRDSTIAYAKMVRRQQKMLAAERQRHEQLEQALKERRPWLHIRSDSQMCGSFIYDRPCKIGTRVPSLEEVVDAVECMDFLYNKTDYAHRLREARRKDHEDIALWPDEFTDPEEEDEREELMEANRREGVKFCIVCDWVKRHAAEDIPTLPCALQSIAWKCHESKVEELDGKKLDQSESKQSESKRSE